MNTSDRTGHDLPDDIPVIPSPDELLAPLVEPAPDDTPVVPSADEGPVAGRAPG